MNAAEAVSEKTPSPSFHTMQRRPWLWAFGAHEILVWLALIYPYPYRPLQLVHRYEAFSRHAQAFFQWDALWFMEIARRGYLHMPHLPHAPAYAGTAFFPFVPVLIHLASPWGAWVLTQGAFAASLWLFWLFLQRMDSTLQTQTWALLLFAFNPACVYYATLYAEPWTALFVLASLEFAHRQRFAGAAVMGGMAATTQAVGLLGGVFPLVGFVMALTRRDRSSALRMLGWGIGCGLGLLAYMAYLAVALHRPLLFSTIQHTSYWSAAWEIPGLQLWKTIPGLVVHGTPAFPNLAPWLATVGLIIGGIGLWTIRRSSWEQIGSIVYGTLGLLVALSFTYVPSPLHSTARLASVYFPLYLGIARTPRWIGGIGLVGFLLVGFYGSILFTHQWWYQ